MASVHTISRGRRGRLTIRDTSALHYANMSYIVDFTNERLEKLVQGFFDLLPRGELLELGADSSFFVHDECPGLGGEVPLVHCRDGSVSGGAASLDEMGVFENFYVDEVGFAGESVLDAGEYLYLGAAGGADAEGRCGEYHHQRFSRRESLVHR